MNRLLALLALPCLAATVAPVAPAPVEMVVTVEARHSDARRDAKLPVLHREDFMARQGDDRLKVTDAIPLTGDLELYILLDDSSQWTLGSELANLRKFIEAQPADTAVGVGYMRNGTVFTAETPTKDHARAAKALRLPIGWGSSPYLSLSDLTRRWPATGARREVIMVSSGVDPLYGPGPMDPYLDAAIADAQRAGIIVYGIHEPDSGHAGHSLYRISWGQNDLGRLADETGGEFYGFGYGAPVSLAPYLTDISEHLAHQYRVSVVANATGKPGLESIRVTTEVPDAEIVAASKVLVPAVP